MTDRFDMKFENTLKSEPQFSAGQLYPDLKDFGRYLQATSDLGTVLPGLDLINNQFGRGLSKQEQVAREADNAKRQYAKLMELSGATAEGRYGLTKEHLDKLATMRLDSADLRDALTFFQKNYDALSTRRFGGTGWDDYDLFADSAITLSSIDRYMTKAEPVGRSAPTRGRGDNYSQPYDSSTHGDERGDRPKRRTGLGSERQRHDDVIVEKNDGWIRIAEKSLRGRDEPTDPRNVEREIERLKRLNPDKVRMVHEGDRIRTTRS